MKSIKEVEQDIIQITSEIQEKFPELSKFIDEIPTISSEKEKLNLKNLEDYYNSLDSLVSEYAKTHKVV